MNKITAFYTCLAAHLEEGGDEVATVFDQIFANPTTPGAIDSAQDGAGNALGPATMAQQAASYALGEIDAPPWLKGLLN